MTIYLTLENGICMEGKSFGKAGETTGEIVFTTGMTGYLETLTDPSYFGQIVLQTFPLIGNYGVIPADFESEKSWVKAYIVKEWCQSPSNFRCEGGLDAFLKAQGIIGIYGLDTRRLTKIIRENGVMNGCITLQRPNAAAIASLKNYKVTEAVRTVTGRGTKAFGTGKYHVVLIDLGYKKNILRQLMEHGCRVTVVPAETKPEEITALCPDGIMLSNGPGDPKENQGIIQNLRALLSYRIPTFGICLGHQLMALASGGDTMKLKYGHRGANQPVHDLRKDRVYITSQNHGYAVVSGSIPPTVGTVSHINGNDGTCEGVSYKNIPAFTVQFHPEAAGGPLDTSYLFDEFLQLMEGGRQNAAQK